MTKRPKHISKHRAFARTIVNTAVRDTFLEDLHSGITPSSKTGDYSDVKVVSPYGEIPWNNVSRLSDKEMRKLMLDVEKKMIDALKWYDEHKDSKEKYWNIIFAQFGSRGISWDDPFYDKDKNEQETAFYKKRGDDAFIRLKKELIKKQKAI